MEQITVDKPKTLTLRPESIITILATLKKLPWEQVNEIMVEIISQVTAEEKPNG
jgi:hypothetical protein